MNDAKITIPLTQFMNQLAARVNATTKETARESLAVDIDPSLIDAAVTAMKTAFNATWKYLLSESSLVVEITQEKVQNIIAALAAKDTRAAKEAVADSLTEASLNTFGSLVLLTGETIATDNHDYMAKVDGLLDGGIMAFLSGAITAATGGK